MQQSLLRSIPALAVLTASVLAAGAVEAKLSHFFVQRGRTYDANTPLGPITDWRDAPCGSSFVWAETNGAAPQRWTVDWRRIDAVRTSTAPRAPGDPAASVYQRQRGVVLVGDGVGALRSDGGRSARSFEVVFHDNRTVDEFMRNANSVREACS